MGHYAKVVDSKVVQVIVAEPDFFNTFVDSSPGQWLQTSYNTRGNVHYLPNSQDLLVSQQFVVTMQALVTHMMHRMMCSMHQSHMQVG